MTHAHIKNKLTTVWRNGDSRGAPRPSGLKRLRDFCAKYLVIGRLPHTDAHVCWHSVCRKIAIEPILDFFIARLTNLFGPFLGRQAHGIGGDHDPVYANDTTYGCEVSFRDVFSLWCISLSFTFTIPQAYRVVRRNTVEGVSVLSQLQSLSGSILWVVYGLVAHTYLVVTANVMTIVGFGTVIIAQVRHRAVSWQRVLVVLTAVIAIAVVSGAISKDVLGLISVVVGGTGIVPQAIRAARTTHLVGVSVATFGMVVIMSVSWSIYGLMIDDLFVVAPNVVIVPSALFIMLRTLQSHHRYGKTTVATAVPAR
jgi:uncharacterized protein with PQ loop repeat